MNSPLSRVRTPLSLWSLRNRLILASVVLASFAIIASDFAANAALRTYLISQVDDQLINISSTSLNRLDRAGIAPLEADDKNSPFKILEPLRGVPTATSITLLDIDGNLIGQVGGELGDKNFAVTGMKIDEVSQYKNRPFTIEGKDGQPDIRALAQMLPTGMGSVIVADSLEKVDKTLSQLRFLFLILGTIALIAIAMAARWIIALGLKPLEAVEDTAEAIAAGDLSARLPAAKPDTEVGRLTTSLNTMLARIEESFTARVESENKLRRFVADASHELRTPLTAIRGFAELHRQGAVVGEEKTKELINRIEKESVRMSSLVEDLLLLARLDQSRELAKEPVDLNTLITEAVASARAAGPNHPIEIKLEASEIFVLGDSQRIHQVGEVVILGGAGNFLMKLMIGSHRVSSLFCGAVEGEQCGLEFGQVLRPTSYSSQCGGLGFYADAELQQGNDLTQGAHVLCADAKRGVFALVQHEGADAVARIDPA